MNIMWDQLFWGFFILWAILAVRDIWRETGGDHLFFYLVGFVMLVVGSLQWRWFPFVVLPFMAPSIWRDYKREREDKAAMVAAATQSPTSR